MKKSVKTSKKEFLEYLENIRGYSDLTIKSYDESLTQAFLHVEIVEENNLTTINLMPYRLIIADLNARTISKKLSAIRSFVEYLNDNGDEVVLKADDSVKIASTLPKPVSHKNILEALKYCDKYEELIVTILYTLGLRISELANIELKDISNEWIRVLGKGNKHRDIPLLEATKVIIDEYLSKNMQKKFIFEKDGEKLSENSLRYKITKIFKRVGLKVTPHQLRHSFATGLLNTNAPISDVSELLGHSSMATTQIYTKLASSFKKQNYNAAHPLCGNKK